MNSYWTETIRNRRKQGFGLGIENWFEEKNLMKFSDDHLKNKDQKIFKYIDFHETQKFLNKDRKHWNLLQLALWAEKKYSQV